MDKQEFLEILKKYEQDSSLHEKQYAIFLKSGNDINRFIRGLLFAKGIVDGRKLTEAYASSFEVTVAEARKHASNLNRAKWVQELVKTARVSDEDEYYNLRKKTIQRLSEVIYSEVSSPKEVIDASRVLYMYIKETAKAESTDEGSSSEDIEIANSLKEMLNGIG